MKIEVKQPYSFRQTGRRPSQEDARFPDADVPREGTRVFVVCDGVGGHSKGEVASAAVADTMGRYMSRQDTLHPVTTEVLGYALGRAYKALNSKMDEHSHDMATTMAMVCVHGGGILAAHIGDSRIYHLRPGVGILYRSEDHSLVNTLVHTGNITPEEALEHPQGNIITRSMGYAASDSQMPSASAIQLTDIADGDYIFICTDGVSRVIGDDEIVEILSGTGSDDDKMSAIARLCRDSSDNNTAILVPIGSVRRDEVSGSDKVGAGSSTTRLLNIPVATVCEVRPLAPSLQSRITRFIRTFMPRK